MAQIYNAASDVDRINAVWEQFAGFIMREILDPRGEFYHGGHINSVRFDVVRGLLLSL